MWGDDEQPTDNVDNVFEPVDNQEYENTNYDDYNNDYDDYDDNDSTSVVSNKSNSNRKTYKKYSKGNRVETKIRSNSGPGSEFNYFMQDKQGRNIINALTGFIYPVKVGSKEEKQFWRVMIPYYKDGSWEGVKLFYDSPEQFESHKGIMLDNYVKQKWRNNINTYNNKNPGFARVVAK